MSATPGPYAAVVPKNAADAIPRTDPARDLGEKDMIAAWLDFHRATLLRKCAGLTDEQLRTRSCEPSTLTLLGLVRHLTDVEHGWFADFDGRENPPRYYTDDDPEGDFENLDSADVATVLATYDAECELSRATLAAHELDSTVPARTGDAYSLRWVAMHMLEEYARHSGHADLLRERIDGTTGE